MDLREAIEWMRTHRLQELILERSPLKIRMAGSGAESGIIQVFINGKWERLDGYWQWLTEKGAGFYIPPPEIKEEPKSKDDAFQEALDEHAAKIADKIADIRAINPIILLGPPDKTIEQTINELLS